mgnify:CR=1 FL=1
MDTSLINTGIQRTGYSDFAYYNKNAESASSSIGVQTDNSTTSASAVKAPKECQTCKRRKYQDQSNDPSVSFQTPQSIPSSFAYSIVYAHENEHVRNEQAAAKAKGLKVVYQSVTIHTGVCPECGKMFISGGTTVTITKPDDSKQDNKKTSAYKNTSAGQILDVIA